LYLAFSATVNMPYPNHDSIRYFHKFYNKDSNSQILPMEECLFAEGRPLTAILEQLFYQRINHLSDMSRLRLMTIVVIALDASLLAMISLSIGMEVIPAFCLSTVIFTLPGVQSFIFVPYLPQAIAIFLSLLAYLMLMHKLKYGIHFIFMFILLEASFCLYPPSSFFFLVPAMLMTLFCPNWHVLKRIWIRDILLWGISAGVYYCTLRLFFYGSMKSTGHEIAFTWKQVLFNITMFLPQAMPQIFNLWNVYFSKTLGISLTIFVAVFIIADFFTAKKIGWQKLLALATIFLIFNLDWFLFGGYVPCQYMASQALVLVLVYWCGKRLGNIWPVFLLSIGLLLTNQMATSNVLNNYSELMFFRSRIAQFVNSSTKEIHVIRLKDTTRGYNGLPTVYDNINNTTRDYEIPDLIRVALKDMGDPFELHCIVTFSNYGEPFKTLADSVVIDMNDLVYISSPEQK